MHNTLHLRNQECISRVVPGTLLGAVSPKRDLSCYLQSELCLALCSLRQLCRRFSGAARSAENAVRHTESFDAPALESTILTEDLQQEII